MNPIVNANILTYLGVTKQLENNQLNSNASKMIIHMCEKCIWSTAGIYYPNAYHLPYVVAMAYKSGASNLDVATKYCLKYLEESRTKEGYYLGKSWLNNGDTILSTAYALHALLDLKEAGLVFSESSINNSIKFLINHKQESDLGTFWKGEVYFTGGTALINIIQWHSDTHTLALIASSLQKILIE
jgi:hypothetical protein